MKEYSLEQLKQYNGKEGRKALIAYDGLIYDVTDRILWQEGKHQVFCSNSAFLYDIVI